MNRLVKGCRLGILSAIILCSICVGVFAAGPLIAISAKIDTTVKVFLNGNALTLKDVTGAAVKPILYKGTYYIPVKDVATASNVLYSFNPTTKVIELGLRSLFVNVNAAMYKDFYGTMYTKDAAKLTFGEKKFKFGITNVAPLTYSDSFLGDVALNSKFTTFYATVCLSENAAKEQIIQFKNKATSEVIKSITMQPGDVLDISFSVLKVNELRIAGEANQGGADSIIIGEPKMK